jgi:hypothetical protein
MMAEELQITINKEGETVIPFFGVSFSDFIVKNVFDETERAKVEQYRSMGSPEVAGKIFCG